MTKRNPQWARDLAREIQLVARDASQAELPRVEVAIIAKVKPEILVRPEGGSVTYTEQEVVWGVDRKALKVGDNVLLTRDTSDAPIVSSVLDGNDPDPTKHVKGKALAKTVEALQQQSRFWKAPVSFPAGLDATTTDANGSVRLVLATNTLHRWDAGSDTWVSISGSGGGASDFTDLTGSLAASQVVNGSIPLSKLSTDPLARANHTGTQLASTISDFSTAVGLISYTESEVDGLLASNSTGDRDRANHTGVQAQSTVTNLVSDLALKAPLASPTFTGTVTVPNVAIGAGTNAATIGAVNTALGSYLTTAAASSTYAPLASPTFTGVPAAPTASGGTNTTQLATTAFVTSAVATAGGAYQPLDTDLTAIAGLTATTDNIIQSKAGAWSSRTPAQFKTDLVLTKSDVGLSNVDNTSDVNKPVSTAQQTALDLKSNLASPTFTGVPAGPTATGGTNTTQLATTAFVTTALSGYSTTSHTHAFGAITGTVSAGQYGALSIVNADISASAAIAQSKVASLTSDLALKAALASPTFTGTPAGPTAAALTNTTQLATTAFVTTADNLKANLASPTFTGTPTLPTGTIGVTQAAGNSTTALATTAFVTTADNLKANLASPTFTGTVTLGALTGGAGAVNLTSSTAVTVPTVAIGAGSNAATIGAVNTALGSYLTTASASASYQPLASGLTTIAGLTATTDSFIQSKGSAWASRTVAQVVTDLVAGGLITSSTVAATYAPLASPTFTGTPLAPTVAVSSNNTSIATTAAVTTALASYSTTSHSHAFGAITGSISAGQYGAGTVVNADVSASAAIAYSKLSLAGTIVNADVSASAAIAYSKLSLAGSIVNADINASAAIAYSKLSLTSSITNADINAAAGIALSKLAVDPLARANHTGTQLASTVSDFDTRVRTSKIHELATPTAATPMGGQKFTGLGAGSANGDSVRYEQVLLLAGGVMTGAIQRHGSAGSDILMEGKVSGETNYRLRWSAGGGLYWNHATSGSNLLTMVPNAGQTAVTMSGSVEASGLSVASPTLTGVPTAPTAAEASANTTLANTAYVDRATGNASSNRPVAGATSSSAQSIGNAVWTAVTFATETEDTDAMVNLGTVNDRFVCVTPGRFTFSGTATFAANSTGFRGARLSHRTSANALIKNIYPDLRVAVTSPTVTEVSVTGQITLAAGEYVALEVYQSSGAALNTSTGSASTYVRMDAEWVGGTGAAWGNSGANVYNGGQAIPASTWTALTFANEQFDIDGVHSTVTNTSRLTCVTPGTYLATGFYSFPSGTGVRGARIQRFNSAGTLLETPGYHENTAAAGTSFSHQVPTQPFQMNVGDYITFEVYNSVGATTNINSQLGMVRVGYQTNPVDIPGTYMACMYLANSGAPTHSVASWQKVGAGGGTSTWTAAWDKRPAGVAEQIDTVNKRVNIQKTGLYHVSVKAALSALAARWLLGVYISGVQGPYIRIPAEGGIAEHDMFVELNLTAGQYLEMWVYQDESVSEAYNVSAQYMNRISVSYMGPAT